MNKSAKSLPLLGGKPRHENWSRLTFDVRTNRPQFSQNLFIFCSFVHPLLSVLSFHPYQVVFGKCFPWPRNSVLVPRHFFPPMHLHLQQLAPSNHKNAGLCLTFYITALSERSHLSAKRLENSSNDCERTLLSWEE